MASPEPLNASTTVMRGSPLGADLNGEFVFMSVDSGKYYGLDTIGSDIWRRIEAPVRIEALCAALSADYDAEPDAIERDVLALLNDLLAQGLIEVKG